MARHPFVVIEGLDGTGKTTLRKALFRLWEGLYGITPLCLLTTNFLDATVAADIVTGKYSPSSDNRDRYMAAVAADKVATLDNLIRPALPDRPVISDRWMLSELAFFGVKHDLSPAETYQQLAGTVTQPADLTFVLDLAPEESIRRAGTRRGDATRADWDVLDVQARVRQIYTEVLAIPRAYPLLGDIVLLDGAANPAETLHLAWRALIDRGLVPALPASKDISA
ncbi:MAG: thymidylate kinase [Actinobacteria bacterium]|nr:thymidylate kinase [Actinomycetota bacterium]